MRGTRGEKQRYLRRMRACMFGYLDEGLEAVEGIVLELDELLEKYDVWGREGRRKVRGKGMTIDIIDFMKSCFGVVGWRNILIKSTYVNSPNIQRAV